MTDERRTARRFRSGRWFLVGLGLLLVAFGLYMVFSPVTTEDSEPSCGDRLAIVAAFGSSTASSLDPSEGEWCRDEAADQVFGGIGLVALPGTLILAWQARQAWRARRAPQDSRPDVAGIAGTPDGLEPAHPFRTLPGRLVPTNNYAWLVLEDRPDQSTLLVVTSRPKPTLPFATREFEVAGDMSRRITFRAPGTDKEFTARPDDVDRLHHWWTARSQRRHGVGLAGDVHGPASHPSIAAASRAQPDPLQSAWAHPPARRRLQRSLRSAGLMLAAALLSAMVIVWAAENDRDWFWEPAEHGEAEGTSMADLFFLGTVFLILTGAVGLARFLRRRSILRRQPWELADIMTPDLGQVVLREHSGALGPLTYRLAATLALHAKVRVLACKQLWFARGDGGKLVAATPDFRTVVTLRPAHTSRCLPVRADAARHSALTGPQDARAPSAQPPENSS